MVKILLTFPRGMEVEGLTGSREDERGGETALNMPYLLSVNLSGTDPVYSFSLLSFIYTWRMGSDFWRCMSFL